jgi:hypothetical protein
MARAVGIAILCLLTMPAALFAPLSIFLLDAPWAAGGGAGIAIIWLMILSFWALAAASAFGVVAMWRLRWPLHRAALSPAVAVAALVALEWAAHASLHRCVLWC